MAGLVGQVEEPRLPPPPPSRHGKSWPALVVPWARGPGASPNHNEAWAPLQDLRPQRTVSSTDLSRTSSLLHRPFSRQHVTQPSEHMTPDQQVPDLSPGWRHEPLRSAVRGPRVSAVTLRVGWCPQIVVLPPPLPIGAPKAILPFPRASGIPQVCAGRGACDAGLTGTGTCHCPLPYSGPACAILCPLAEGAVCAGHGDCVALAADPQRAGQCLCWRGPGRGYWRGPRCDECADGYTGPHCTAQCPGSGNCTGHGRCTWAAGPRCACHRGWQGEDCAVPLAVDGPCEACDEVRWWDLGGVVRAASF